MPLLRRNFIPLGIGMVLLSGFAQRSNENENSAYPSSKWTFWPSTGCVYAFDGNTTL